MKTTSNDSTLGRRAFTLVEMLVVIAVIATLAAMIFPAFGLIKRRAAIQKAQTELKLVASAITDYKNQYRHYPPDHPGNPIINGLYFELLGTVLTNASFQTKNGDAKIQAAAVAATFGQGGFVNCTKGGGDDNTTAAKKFLVELKPAQYGEIPGGANDIIRLLACSVKWPDNTSPLPASPGLNPWRYVSSSPTNNPGEFDLWVDIIVGSKTNRICNWSDKPLIVP
jgi:prepilin-type N-terminal cleavage/methylation domain-containing protein